ncbi:T9SS type A sorting domain-containing protein [Cryomorphaceae bacterium 1068]|nr:T9SS type A sorting domain-containing protein [Cryomorphaceae bacterium 1068]
MTKIRLFRATMLSAALLLSTLTFGQSDLIITAVFDATLTGGTPKGAEIYVLNDVADLSVYGIGSANNGGGSDGEEFTFPAVSAMEGDFIYVSSDSARFNEFFGFDSDYVSGALSINGDDAVELFQGGVAVDVFGDINVDGSGQAWEYADSWAYRANGSTTTTTFNAGDWTIPGPDALDGETTNASASQPVPVGTFDPEGGSTTTVYTINEIQETTDPSGDSPRVGETVETSGIVTAVGNGGFWIQDGTGAWSGIFVLDASTIAMQGDNVTVTGAVQESNGLTRISATSVAVNSSANPLPSATSVSTGAAGVEEFESVLLSVSGAICVNADAGFGEYVLNDGSGDYRADDALFAFVPTQFAEYDAIGVGFFSFGNFKLLPRDADDIEDTGNNQLVVGFAATEADVLENEGAVSFAVNIVNPSISATDVDVVVTGGTAVAGVDYTFSGPVALTFAGSSNTPQSFSVTIIDNGTENEDKTIAFGLANATNGALLLPDAFTLTILDDEVTLTDIAVAAETDIDGVAINNGQEYNILGVVLGVNLSSTGQQFTVVDATGGIGVFSGSIVSEYVVTEGDQVLITGSINQFNGLTQIAPTAISVISQGNAIPNPVDVDQLGELTESRLVVFECATILDPADWTNAGSGFNVDVSNGTDTITIRIDNDTDLYNEPAPTGEFDVVGIGGQFDFSSPFLSGYQLLPRTSADILASSCATPVCENPFPAVNPASLNTTLLSNAVLTEWEEVDGQIGCQIQVRLAGAGSLLGAKIIGGVNADSFVIPGSVLNPGTDYEWRVRCGCSQTPLVAGPFSAWQFFSTGSGISISSSPNPTNGQSFVNFSVSQSEMTTLEVYDMTGKMVEALFSGIAQPGSDYRFEFNGTGLPNGIYIYRLTTESEVKTEKFMISK